jgi:hypothetical protein
MVVLGTAYLLVMLPLFLQADQLVHRFGSPSFNGINQSAHYLRLMNKNEQEL